MSRAILELRGISKSFGGIPALKPLTLAIAPGEVAGLIGENGAGKSTFIKLLSGVYQPDSGTLQFQGIPVRFANPHEAMEAGIATIHQELACFEQLTVAENLFMDERWPRKAWGGVDWNRLFENARERLTRCELEIDPRAFVHTLSAAQRQEIAIARALNRNARLLILDEPTASLGEPDVRRLLAHLARLRAQGITLIYVSHRLDEILELTTRVLVLRDGELVADYPTGEASIPRMVRDMVGRSLEIVTAGSVVPAGNSGTPALQLKGLSREGLFRDVSFDLHRGEILGLGGLVGAGRSEIARCIFGLYPPDAGEMLLGGEPWHPGSALEAQRAGIAYIPEERKRQALALSHPLAENISITWLRGLSRAGWIYSARERRKVADAIGRFSIRAHSPAQPAGTLSGGNQQKALLARWLELDPHLIILDEPTRGVDIGAKTEIHRLIIELADHGKAVLLISSDLPELLALSQRVLVLYRGGIAGELAGNTLTQENVLLAASGS